MKVIGTSAPQVFMRKVSGPEKQVPQRTEEFTIKMGDIVHKMGYQVPETFFWLNILLAANVAEPAMNGGTAVEADLFFSFG